MSFTQLLLEAISRAYNYTLLIAVVYSFVRYKRLDMGSRFICMLIWLGAVSETIAWFAAVKFRNNLPVYAISSICEFAITCLYFNSTLRFYKKWNIGIICAVAGILFGVMNIAVFQPLNTINSNFLFFECLGVVCLSLFSIYQRLMATDMRLLKEIHFWIPCILLFYKCTALWNWGIYDYVTARHEEKTIFLNIGILLINVLTYLAFTLLLLFYPKMRRTHV